MASESFKDFPSKYRCVKGVTVNGKKYWQIRVYGYTKKLYKTEHEAAVAVDKIYIKKGKDPVNVLKKI
jgi:hypothetical protein